MDVYDLVTEGITSTILYFSKLSPAHRKSEEGTKISPLDGRRYKEYAAILLNHYSPCSSHISGISLETYLPFPKTPKSFIISQHQAQAQGSEYHLLNQGHMQMRLFKFSALAMVSLHLKSYQLFICTPNPNTP